MRYAASRKEETRSKLLASARAIAKQRGFGVTGVDQLMASIGLSGAAFYGHFPTKEALFAELVLAEVGRSSEMLAGDRSAAADHVAGKLREYLSAAHVRHPEAGCVLPALGAEIARSDAALRKAVERSLKALQANWRARLDDGDAAWALLAQCVGALMLARMVEGERTRNEILGSSRRFIDRTHALPTPLEGDTQRPVAATPAKASPAKRGPTKREPTKRGPTKPERTTPARHAP